MLGLVMALGFVAAPRIAMGLDDMGAAPGWNWIGYLGCIGKVSIYPAWSVWLGRAVNADGTLSADGVAAIDRVKRVAALEMLGFAVIFTCMILMRFPPWPTTRRNWPDRVK